MPTTPLFERVRETSWQMLTLIVVILFGYEFVSLFVQSQEPVMQALTNLSHATGGLVLASLIFGTVYLFVIALSILGISGLRPSDVGWDARAIWPALLVTVACWVLMQGILALAATIGDGQFAWRQAWRHPGLVVGRVIELLPGSTFGEETIYRDFLLVQVYLKAARKYRREVACIIAVAGSSVVFSLWHLPGDLYDHGFDESTLIFAQFFASSVESCWRCCTW